MSPVLSELPFLAIGLHPGLFSHTREPLVGVAAFSVISDIHMSALIVRYSIMPSILFPFFFFFYNFFFDTGSIDKVYRKISKHFEIFK